MEDAFRSKHSIATSRWMTPDEVEGRFQRQDGDFWIGRNAYRGENPIGFGDDRHVMVVSGSRGGKGVSVIVPNLCLWPGSIVVVDPKGENATLTAARRGDGSEHCDGMGQHVYVLDPMGVAKVEDKYRARFNPLDALDPDSEHVIDDASRLADALIEVGQGEDRHWDEGARALVRTLILYVLTNPRFEGRRNLLTVRRLIQRGDWEAHARDKARRAEAEKPIKSPLASPHELLWELAAQSTALGGVIAAAADGFLQSAKMASKQYESFRKIAETNMEFLDSPGMARCVEASDFSLADLKTDRKGVSVYLSLPQRSMSTHYRWLRMMIALTVTEMEVVPGQPASGAPILLAMDEFAGLRRMEIIENTVAQIAGYGVKLFFVLQSLEQLKSVYPDRWETFLANCGVRIFFATTDNFTNQYVSESLGEQEIVRIVRNRSESSGESTSQSDSTSESYSEQESTADTRGSTTGQTRGGSEGSSRGGSQSRSRGGNQGRTRGGNYGRSTSQGTGQSYSESFGPGWFFNPFAGSQEGKSRNESQGTSQGESWSDSFGKNWSDSQGQSWSDNKSRNWGDSRSQTRSQTVTKGSSTTTSRSSQTGSSRSRGLSEGESEQVFKKPLVTKDEMAKMFTRIDDPNHRAYPGIALVTIAGEAPMLLRRTPYYQDPAFVRLFDPHPDHPMMEAPAQPEELEKPKPTWPRDHGFYFDSSAYDKIPENRERMAMSGKYRDRLLAQYFEKKYSCMIDAPIGIVHDMFLDINVHRFWLELHNPHIGLKAEPESKMLTSGSLIYNGFLRDFRDRVKERGLLEADIFSLSRNFNVPIFFDIEFWKRGENFTEMKLEKYWYESLPPVKLLELFGLKRRGLYPRNNKHYMDRHGDDDLIPADAHERGWDMSEAEANEDVRRMCLRFKDICEDVAHYGCPEFAETTPIQWVKAPVSGTIHFLSDYDMGLPLEPGDRFDATGLMNNCLHFSDIEYGNGRLFGLAVYGSGLIEDVRKHDGEDVEEGERILRYRPD